ncbi:MAG: methyltransferase domain-containing protein [Desulfobacterales bacterium]|nr:methyltransferase domain-containing protein [Desulfobacterales bacterium]
MSQNDLNDLKQAEAAYFDRIADIRTANDHIPVEADLRRATKFIPKRSEKQALIDLKMTAILAGRATNQYISLVSHQPGGRVLDIGCGSGWLALEYGRHGQHVDAYDISPKAIALAERMLAENPYKDGFGEVNYHLQDVTDVDLGEEKYDAISGWSAFHHLPDLPAFMERVSRALKPGGIVATMDDMPRGRFERGCEYLLQFILPIFPKSYPQKISTVFQLIIGKKQFPAEVFTPMEEAKHSSVDDIKEIFYEKFDVIVNLQQNAFVGTPVMQLSGPDSFRYPAARILVALDRLMCHLGIVNGFERIMIARKRA